MRSSVFSRTVFLGSAVFTAVFLLMFGHLLAQVKRGGDPEAAKLTNPVASSAESIGAGQQTYQRYCRGCHGKDATGGPPKEADEVAAPNLIDAEWRNGETDGEVFTSIKKGVPPDYDMGPWGDRLSDTEIWNIVNF